MHLPSQSEQHPSEPFSGYLADTVESRRIHHRIRYQVYCERKGFEDNALVRKRGLEMDSYDGHALPFIVRDELEGRWRGTARLVIRGATALPMEALEVLPPGLVATYSPGTVAEVSRLASLPALTAAHHDRWGLLKATLGTFLACAQDLGIHAVLFLITQGLARVVSRFGIPMTVCSRPVEHRGERRAYLSEVSEALIALEAQGIGPQCSLYSQAAGISEDRLLA